MSRLSEIEAKLVVGDSDPSGNLTLADERFLLRLVSEAREILRTHPDDWDEVGSARRNSWRVQRAAWLTAVDEETPK